MLQAVAENADEHEPESESDVDDEAPRGGPMPDVGAAGLSVGVAAPDREVRYADEVAWTRAYNAHGRDTVEAMVSFIKEQKAALGDDSYNLDLSKFDPGALNEQQRVFYSWLKEAAGHGADHCQGQIRAVIRGGGGVGKSFTINCFRRWLLDSGLSDCMAVLAPTGTAAFNVAGNTLHAGLKLPAPLSPASFRKLENDSLADLQRAFHAVRVLVVDEMSMVGRRALHVLDSRLRQAKAAPNTLFGGVHIFLIGDFGQLPPNSDLEMFSSKVQKPGGQRYDNLSIKGKSVSSFSIAPWSFGRTNARAIPSSVTLSGRFAAAP